MYVASPHALHDEHTRLALEAGKPVLCEKPMTLDADSAASLFEEAAARGLFLMEAMWTACHPSDPQAAGPARRAGSTAPHARSTPTSACVVEADPSDRLLDPALGPAPCWTWASTR